MKSTYYTRDGQFLTYIYGVLSPHVVGETITVDGKAYRIVRIHTSIDGGFVSRQFYLAKDD